jgi:hypothetical protein
MRLETVWHRRYLSPDACSFCGTRSAALERFVDHQGVVARLRCVDADECLRRPKGGPAASLLRPLMASVRAVSA